MRLSFTLITMAIEAAVVAAQSGRFASPITSAIKPTASKAYTNPCAVISSHTDVYFSKNPQSSDAPVKPSELYACLQDVPISPTLGVAQIAWIQKFLQFQSTLAYLKNPPPTYQPPAVDLVGGLNNITRGLTAGMYRNEYDLELDIYNLIASANDGHLNYIPYLVGSFPYVRNATLVSVSLDGVQVPKIYFQSDILNLSNSTFTPSAIASINGQDVNQYMAQLMLKAGFQDLDAQYNSMFYNPATNANNLGGAFALSPVFSLHNDTTSYKFENGTSVLFNATALIPLTVDLPASGQAIFEQNLLSLDTNSSSPSSVTPTSSPSMSPSLPTATGSANSSTVGPGYPLPIVKHSANIVSGYFLNGSDNSDVAVLNVASFEAESPAAAEFQNDVSTFLVKCRSAGKTRLIIDVRGNPGGTAYLGFDLFKQLFPTAIPYSGVRIRGSDAANAMGQIASTSPVQNSADSQLASSFFNDQAFLQGPDGPSFSSWQQLYGPLQQHDDIFSNVASWQFSNASLDIQSGGIVISGYANNLSTPPQVFLGENITLLTDGSCSSTCTIFSNLAINQGRVKTATAGGRPNNQPMAVIGGVQGSQVLKFADISGYATEAIGFQANLTRSSSTQGSQLLDLLGPLTLDAPINPQPSEQQPSINFLDSIAQGDKSMTPLQFAGSPTANCRFYYTPADIVNVANTWARVAKGIKAGGSGLCINGTLSNSTRANGTGYRTFSTTANVTAAGRSNRTGLVTFQGSASILGCAQFGWVAFAFAFGSLAVLL